jgi:glycosyltransferase involved in cell wall biosynthesis
MKTTGGKKIIKLGVLVSHPIQYFVPLYRKLATNPNLDLTVLYRTRVGLDESFDPGFGKMLKWDLPLLGGYRCEFLSNKKIVKGFEPVVLKALLAHRFDVMILHGYNSVTNLVALALAKILGTRVLIRGDTRLQQHHFNGVLKKAFKKMIFRLADGFLSIGSLNRDYYLAFGVESERIRFAPFCVDNAFFVIDGYQRLSARQRYRSEIGLPEDAVMVLFSAKLTAQKGATDLIKAFAKIDASVPKAWLVIAGSGSEESRLKALVAELKLSRVLFIGFVNQTSLPNQYAASDIFVLPAAGHEQWGLAVNEAMAAGLPVIVSDQVGAAPDLIQDKGTGIVYPCGDIDALAHALQVLTQFPEVRKDMGNRASALIQAWDVHACADAIAATVVDLHDRSSSNG